MPPEKVGALGSGLLCREQIWGRAGSRAWASVSCGCGLLYFTMKCQGFEMLQDRRGSSSQGQAYPLMGEKLPLFLYQKKPRICFEVRSKTRISF